MRSTQYHARSGCIANSSRNESDEEDTHQRICLHAEILTPSLDKVGLEKYRL